MDKSVNKKTEWIDYSQNAAEQEKMIQSSPSNTLSNEEEKTQQIMEENRSDIKNNQFIDKSEEFAFSKIMDAVKDLSNEKHLCPRITFLDFAGQSMYYAFHQVYLSAKTCYILVVDMTKRPNEQVLETDEQCCSLFRSWTYKGIKTSIASVINRHVVLFTYINSFYTLFIFSSDFYKFWLKSIDSYGDTNSPVILVGTHAEKFTKQVS